MKLIIVFILLTITGVFSKPHHHSKHHRLRKLPPSHQQTEPLSQTPKGLQLKDHFGQNSTNSIYGPKPHLIKGIAKFTNQDGSTFTTEISRVVGTNSTTQSCDITATAEFQLCYDLSYNCDLCSANPNCGWCERSQRCFPGNQVASSCPSQCKEGWKFDRASCTGSIGNHTFTNVANDATKIVSPVLTPPKVKINTTITQPTVVSTPVLLGNKVVEHQVTRVNARTGEIEGNDTIKINKPIVGEIHQVLNVNTPFVQYVDVQTGKRIDSDPTNPKNIAYHGTENYNIAQ